MPGPSVPTGGPVAPAPSAAPSAGGPGPMGTTATEDLENFGGAARPTDEEETRDPAASDVDDPQ